MEEVRKCVVLAARTLIEKDPAYSYVTARLLLDALRFEALGEEATQADMQTKYAEYFPQFVKHGIKVGLLNEALTQYDLAKLGAALKPERDLQFGYLGLQTLYDRYFLVDQYVGGRRFELPQCFFMRVAMGLALNEVDREARAIEFYDVLSTFDFMSSTPTLFNSGTHRSQLSSCYLTTVSDDLDGIYEAIKENALLSKFAGGLGNDWTNVRAMGSHIKGTNGKSQGVVPFLKVVNDTAVAVNQCFAPDTQVYTSRGVLPIRQVQTGDLVLGQSGVYREVTDKLVYEQTEPMVAVDVKHSLAPIEVTDAHPFWALCGVPLEQSSERTHDWIAKGKIAPKWTDAGQLKVGDYIGLTIPTEVVPVDGIAEDDARLYGILLGDGHLSKDGKQWSVSGNPARDEHLAFVQRILAAARRAVPHGVAGRDASAGAMGRRPRCRAQRDDGRHRRRRAAHDPVLARRSVRRFAPQADRAAACAPAASADARARARAARIRRRRLARRRDLFHVRVAAARRRSCAISACASACRSAARCASVSIRTDAAGDDSPRSRSTSPRAHSTCAFPPCPRSPRSWAASRSPSATGSRSAAPCSRACAP